MFNLLVSLIIASQLIGPITGIVVNVNQSMDLGFPQRRITDSFEPVIEAQNAIVLDVASGKVLFQKKAFERKPIASLTKLMTAIVFVEQDPDWEKAVIITQDDKQSGGKVQVFPGEVIRLRDVFNTALIGSANNAAYELARATDLSYDDFILKMNEKAEEIGMENFRFVEPTGLNPKNQATARDVASMLDYAMSQDEIRKSLSMVRYSFQAMSGQDHYIKNTNELLDSYLKPIGGKTGYLDEAGFCLASLVETNIIQKGIITVILGAQIRDARFQDNKFVTQWVLDNWRWSD